MMTKADAIHEVLMLLGAVALTFLTVAVHYGVKERRRLRLMREAQADWERKRGIPGDDYRLKSKRLETLRRTTGG